VPLPTEQLKQYISYAKLHCRPQIPNRISMLISTKYAQARQHCQNSATGMMIPVTLRMVDSLVSISEALAKMRLAKSVGTGDVNEAYRLITSACPDMCGGADSQPDLVSANPEEHPEEGAHNGDAFVCLSDFSDEE
jgi:DNA replicative helicase MCM subunit Mcm2 (Cdc46/Mcm family)